MKLVVEPPYITGHPACLDGLFRVTMCDALGREHDARGPFPTRDHTLTLLREAAITPEKAEVLYGPH